MRTTPHSLTVGLVLFWLLLEVSAFGWQDPLSNKATVNSADPDKTEYILGPEDRINIRAADEETLADRVVRIDDLGEINLPQIGRVHAAGLTMRELELELATRLKVYLTRPEVIVSLIEGRSQPISVIGSVAHPGIIQLQGNKTLVEIITMAGGLSPDAGYYAKILRRLKRGSLPLPGAAQDSTGQYSVGKVNLQAIMEGGNLEQNILIRAEDIISIPRAELVYVLGEVQKTGGIVLSDQETLTLMKAIALAGGFQRTADPKNARILRPAPGVAKRAEISVDLRKIFEGGAADLSLMADDILYIPSSVSKKAAIRTLETLLSVGTTAVTYGIIYRPR